MDAASPEGSIKRPGSCPAGLYVFAKPPEFGLKASIRLISASVTLLSGSCPAIRMSRIDCAPRIETLRAWVFEALVTPPSNTIASNATQAAASASTDLGIHVSPPFTLDNPDGDEEIARGLIELQPPHVGALGRCVGADR